ncbi:MAG TPA: hypothetical protein VK746_03170 [Candidatus Eisenbacteria bacterium]|jgi:hypothetical protein|nr:hypothetical protein [Candidatus Eisenbacteria bacterium]
MPPVDPNEVMMTGENSFIRLSPDGGKTLTDRASHWRVLWCPAGGGHALFLQSTLTDGRVRIYSDNIAVARWLQKSIETLLFPAFADTSIPVIGARFERQGGPWSSATETVQAVDARVTMTWYDCIEPFVLNAPPGFNDRPIGVFSTFFPARSAQLEINGKVATNSVWAEMRGDRQGSSATLAWSETWVKPRG